jgi:hypothetical protein
MLNPTDAQLIAFLEEALPPDQLSQIEQRLRDDIGLRQRLAAIIGREDAGLHSIAVIWRRRRLSCPDRDELSQYFLGVLDEEPESYIRFHIEQVGCRYCAANLEDLQQAQAAASQNQADPATRRRRYFETSAGHLRREK